MSCRAWNDFDMNERCVDGSWLAGTIQALLSEINKQIMKHDVVRNEELNRGESFNVFSLCGVDHYETSHSKILAEFLSPNGCHGQKSNFLKLFCDELGKSNQRFEGEYSHETDVTTEVSGRISGVSIGRFDILLEDASTKSVMVVENKIFAGEQPQQLKRYMTWLKEREKIGWRTTLVFLTLDGRDGELKNSEYIRMSYKENILNWLRECQKLSVELPYIRETIGQYIKHIEKLTIGGEVMNEKIVELMCAGNMIAAQKIFDNYKLACVRMANELLSEVRDELRATGNDWQIDSALDFNRKESGVLFECGDPARRISANIYVIFAETNLWGCEVALWQDKERLDFHDRGLLDKSWDYAEENTNSWRVWKQIKTGPNWDGAFFDTVKNDELERRKVVNEIVEAIKTLYGSLLLK